MTCIKTSSNINETFIITSQDNDTMSACTSLSTNLIISCSGDTSISLSDNKIVFDGNLYTNDSLSANTIYASTYYSGGTNLIDLIGGAELTGGTYDNLSGTLSLYNSDSKTIIISGFTDIYTTGSTFNPTTKIGTFTRNDGVTYDLDLSTLSNFDIYTTASTFNNITKQVTFQRTDGNDYVLDLSSLSTFDTFVTGGTYSNGILTFTNNSGNTFTITGLTQGTVTSVGLTMPSAFTVSNSPVVSAGTINVVGAGTVSQYIRGDGTLASFPSGGGGGGGTVYYLNGNTSQGLISGITMYQLSTVAGTGAAANFNRSTVGTIASFITDIGQPNQTTIPAGIWLFQCYLSETGGGSNPAEIQAVIEKWNGTNITVISTGIVEQITNGNVKDLYTFGVTIPSGTTLNLTDRIVIQLQVSNPNGKTVTLYTEDGDLSSVTTTFANGIASLNGLTKSSQFFSVGSGSTYLSISSSGDTHTFNLISTTRRADFVSPYSYNGWAPEGSPESNNVWTITRITVNDDGSTTKGVATNVSWTGRASHIYT
jgi:hypothetical protein